MTNPAPKPARDRVLGARRDQVRDHVLTAGFARLDDLAAQFGVSLMTIHRDVDALAEEGWLTKMRGSATANPSALAEASVSARAAAMAPEKRAIADVAAGLLGRGQAVCLDDSTTAMAIVPHLLAHAPAMIATNFLPAISALGSSPTRRWPAPRSWTGPRTCSGWARRPRW